MQLRLSFVGKSFSNRVGLGWMIEPDSGLVRLGHENYHFILVSTFLFLFSFLFLKINFMLSFFLVMARHSTKGTSEETKLLISDTHQNTLIFIKKKV